MTIVTPQSVSGDAVLVTVDATQGSVPRERGAWMLVFAHEAEGTIGGGHLELDAIAHARRLLAREAGETRLRRALGPSLGQCCGGVVELSFERVATGDLAALRSRLAPALAPLALFGGGHVGRAIVDAVSLLPFAIRWIDSRDEIFPQALSAHVTCEHSDPVEGAVADLVPGSCVLVMSFSHAEDLGIVAACLQRLRERDDLPFVGLIGSATKWATFGARLRGRGFGDDELARITCPIGIEGIRGKEPAVIAAAVAAQLLQRLGR